MNRGKTQNKLTNANPLDGSGHISINVSAFVRPFFTIYLISVVRWLIISVVLGVTIEAF